MDGRRDDHHQPRGGLGLREGGETSMTSSEQSPVETLRTDIRNKLAACFRANAGRLEAMGEFTQSHLPKFSFLGETTTEQVIANFRSRSEGGGRHLLTREQVATKVLEWLSSNISEQFVAGLVEFTVTGVTQQRQGQTAEQTVEGSVAFQDPLRTRTITDFQLVFDDIPVGASLAFTIDVDAELTIKNVVTKVQTEPVFRFEKIDFRDCEAGVVVKATHPTSFNLGEFTVPIKGEFHL
jgi:hypothetical protein